MTLEIKITADKAKFQEGYDTLGSKFKAAFSASLNMIASMIRTQSLEDIRNAGNFGASYTQGLKVTVDGNSVITMLDAPGSSIFEDGGTIQGNPLLWIPLSGTDAEGIQASNYSGGLFSVNRKAGGAPLLFSISDRQPKYFGISSVVIPKKFHLGEIQANVMANFKTVFENALE